MQTARQSTRLLRSTRLSVTAAGKIRHANSTVSALRRCQTTSSHPLSGQESFNKEGNPLAGPSKDKEVRSGPPTELLTVLEETIKVSVP